MCLAVIPLQSRRKKRTRVFTITTKCSLNLAAETYDCQDHASVLRWKGIFYMIIHLCWKEWEGIQRLSSELCTDLMKGSWGPLWEGSVSKVVANTLSGSIWLTLPGIRICGWYLDGSPGLPISGNLKKHSGTKQWWTIFLPKSNMDIHEATRRQAQLEDHLFPTK